MRFKVYNPDRPGINLANVILLVLLLLAEITIIFYFLRSYNSPAKSFLITFLMYLILLDFFNRLFSIEYLYFDVKDAKLIIRQNKIIQEFNLKDCDIQYHSDKDVRVSLNHKGKVYSWTLVKPVTKNIINYLNKLKGRD